MTTNTKMTADAGVDIFTSSDILVCSNDGRLLRRFLLNVYDDDVRSLGAAERVATKNTSDNQGKRFVVVVSNETSTKLRLTQTGVAANEPHIASSPTKTESPAQLERNESLRVLGPLLRI